LSLVMLQVGVPYKKKLWSCDFFWIWFYNLYWEGHSPSPDGREPSCLQLLREALKLYHTAGGTVER
jgi:hypothetical protein